jgi:hypothetical protein
MRKSEIKKGVRFTVECEIGDVDEDVRHPNELYYGVLVGGEFVADGITHICKAYLHFKVIKKGKKK